MSLTNAADDIHEDIDAAVFLLGHVEEPAEFGSHCRIRNHADHLPASVPDRGAGLVQRLLIFVADREVDASARETRDTPRPMPPPPPTTAAMRPQRFARVSR